MTRNPSRVGSGWTGVSRRMPDFRPVCSSGPISACAPPASPRSSSQGFTAVFTKAEPILGSRLQTRVAAARAAMVVTMMARIERKRDSFARNDATC